jgi:hypothetical protein
MASLLVVPAFYAVLFSVGALWLFTKQGFDPAAPTRPLWVRGGVHLAPMLSRHLLVGRATRRTPERDHHHRGPGVFVLCDRVFLMSVQVYP